MVRILIADNQEMVLQGLNAHLKGHNGWEVCGEARNGREAVKLAMKLTPDIVILDLTMPELNGLAATRQILRELPETEVLIFSAHDSEHLIREVLSVGARGYVLKSDPACHLTSAVEALAQHQPYFTSKVSESLLEYFINSTPVTDDGSAYRTLTNRECEIVQLLAEAKSSKEIASTLFISIKTVQTHRATIMRKLGIRSVVELVHYAIRNQLVEA